MKSKQTVHNRTNVWMPLRPHHEKQTVNMCNQSIKNWKYMTPSRGESGGAWGFSLSLIKNSKTNQNGGRGLETQKGIILIFKREHSNIVLDLYISSVNHVQTILAQILPKILKTTIGNWLLLLLGNLYMSKIPEQPVK